MAAAVGLCKCQDKAVILPGHGALLIYVQAEGASKFVPTRMLAMASPWHAA